jgi:hypothetical protein
MSILGDIAGLFDGGSSSTVSSTVNIDVQGLNDIGLNETITLQPVTLNENIDLQPVTLNQNIDLQPVTLNQNIDLQPVTLNENIDLQPVTLNENIDLQPVTLNENIDLQPVTLNENIDLKPVAVDTCQTLRLAPLPETRVSSPYHHRVTYHLFGMEMMNVSFTGESGQNIESPHHPRVIEDPRWAGGHRDEHSMTVSESQGIHVRVLRPGEE